MGTAFVPFLSETGHDLCTLVFRFRTSYFIIVTHSLKIGNFKPFSSYVLLYASHVLVTRSRARKTSNFGSCAKYGRQNRNSGLSEIE